MSVHHPHQFPTSTHHSQSFPIHFPRFRKVLQEGSILLQDCQNTQGINCFYHILKNIHLFSNMFHRDMHMDDVNMLKKFQQILVHTFREIGLHHLQSFLFFLKIHAFVG